MRTVLGKLRQSTGGLPIHRIEYGTPGSKKRTPTRLDLATKKRPMFDYEREVRIVQAVEENVQEGLMARCLDWDPEKWIDLISIHPEADDSFMRTVTMAVAHYAPSLEGRITWSAMREVPPLTPGALEGR